MLFQLIFTEANMKCGHIKMTHHFHNIYIKSLWCSLKIIKLLLFLASPWISALILAWCKAVKHSIFCGPKMQFKFVNTNLDRIFFHYMLMKIIFLDTYFYNPLMGGFLVGTFLFYFTNIKWSILVYVITVYFR